MITSFARELNHTEVGELATVVEGDLKVSFSIAWGGALLFFQD